MKSDLSLRLRHGGATAPRTRSAAGRRAGSRTARAVLLGAVAVLLFHLCAPPFYRFPAPAPFAGPAFWNPYRDARGPWLRANFHAHSKRLLGLLAGHGTAHALRGAYLDLGYDVAGVSNYQAITPPGPREAIYVTDYEHGYGAGQQHQTVLGAPGVSWLDFPLYQGARQKQWILDELAASASAVIINHPDKRDGYTLQDMERLTGYTGVELMSRFSRGLAHWDAALRSGHPVWGFCSDDCHDVASEPQRGIGWLMIDAREKSAEAVLGALHRGRFYSVWSPWREPANALVSCEVCGGTLRVAFAEPAQEIRFVGPDGILDGVTEAVEATYALRPEDPYVRVEATTGGSELYLNPVLRCADSGADVPPPAPVARVALAPTWAARALGVLTLALLARLLFGSRRRWRAGSAVRRP